MIPKDLVAVGNELPGAYNYDYDYLDIHSRVVHPGVRNFAYCKLHFPSRLNITTTTWRQRFCASEYLAIRFVIFWTLGFPFMISYNADFILFYSKKSWQWTSFLASR